MGKNKIDVLEISDNTGVKKNKKNGGFWKKHGLLMFFPLSLLFLEIAFSLLVYTYSWGSISILKTLLYILLFSTAAGAVMQLLSTLFKSRKLNFAISLVISILLFIWFSTQIVYFTFFQRPLPLNSVGGAGQVMGDFISIVFSLILKKLYAIVIFFLPTLFLIIFGRKIFSFKRTKIKYKGVVVLICIVAHLCGLGAVQLTKGTAGGAYDCYYNVYDVASTQRIFGVFTNFRLDFKRMIFGFEEKIDNDKPIKIEPTTEQSPNTTDVPLKPQYGLNVMDIDFDELIANEENEEIKAMHEYFSQKTGTTQNEYTGMFKDCNLIMLCAESFSSYAIDEKLTPTLYKLATEGFEFTNYYNPLWWTSTTDGEYTTSVGLIPKSGIWSHRASSENYLPFCFGNQFEKLGYSVYAYHDHTYTYYDRDITYPAMGYKNYKALGNGLEVAKYWPESDLEMMQKTVDEYVNDDKFHVYYMTVSGHGAYTYLGNYQASKNRQYVEDLGLSEGASAYLSCNLELEFAMQYLLDALQKAGKLDNTVIVMYGDHYPYALSHEELSELAGHDIDDTFEIYKSSLIIWKNGMEHTVVDKTVMSLDIVPTVSNLFGLQYDSRLLVGNDVFSDEAGLAILSDRSWITDLAAYDASTGEVTSFTGEPVSQEYIDTVNTIVKQSFVYSVKILENDYWGKVFGKVSSSAKKE